MSRSKQQQTWDRWIAKKERAAYLRGLKDAKAFCDMARAGFHGSDRPKEVDAIDLCCKELSERLSRLIEEDSSPQSEETEHE